MHVFIHMGEVQPWRASHFITAYIILQRPGKLVPFFNIVGGDVRGGVCHLVGWFLLAPQGHVHLRRTSAR